MTATPLQREGPRPRTSPRQQQPESSSHGSPSRPRPRPQTNAQSSPANGFNGAKSAASSGHWEPGSPFPQHDDPSNRDTAVLAGYKKIANTPFTIPSGDPSSAPRSSEPRRSPANNARPGSAPDGAADSVSGEEDIPSRPVITRTATEYSEYNMDPAEEADILQDSDVVRHGFENLYQNEEYISMLKSNWYMYFTDKRHETNGNPGPLEEPLQEWRMKDRLKTVSAALAVCLNIGVEPPDQLKTTPGAKMEAWCDPTKTPVQKSLEAIGAALQNQYSTLALRTRYKQYLDPSVDETKKFCVSLRRNAKDERVLFHYNGHGVPKPTASGEIWVFNKNYTQYIPVSLYDLQAWLQAPTFFVWDCSDAGNILNNFHRFVDKHEVEEEEALAKDPSYNVINYRPFIHLAACGIKENLPTNPLLPADVFTCCLTTPIEMALWYFALQNPLPSNITPERARNLPGRLQERRTPLGELNWIFTAITDTIAWTTLSRDLFRKFFRQDLMVAALFRNFLLAQRVMQTYGCHPKSYPELPDTHQHPLWESWDLAVEMALAQLPQLEQRDARTRPDYEFQNSTFFTEQLTAFEVYLTQGALERQPPEQLPVVLQVLLSQQHRVRALVLLGKFLDMGPWAVNLALNIGIFPYVLKLLQSAAAELKPVMVFIWTRVLAVDLSCQSDLLKDSGYNYFTNILQPQEGLPIVDGLEHKAMCAFILAMLCNNYKQGQNVCNMTDVLSYCLVYIQNNDNPLLRQWSCLCISQLWSQQKEAKWRGIREGAHAKLAELTRDSCCEVRASLIYAYTTFLGIPEITGQVARIEESMAWTLLEMGADGSSLVRKELLVFFSTYIDRYENKFLVTAFEHLQEERDYLLDPPPTDYVPDIKLGLHYARRADIDDKGYIKPTAHGVSQNSIFAAIWKHVWMMGSDPHAEVRRNASIVIDSVHKTMLLSEIGGPTQSLIDEINKLRLKSTTNQQSAAARPGTPIRTDSMPNLPLSQQSLLKRTASFIFNPFLGGVGTENSPSEGSSRSGPKSPAMPPSYRNSHPLRRAGAGDLDYTPETPDAPSTPGSYHAAKEPVPAMYVGRDMSITPTIPLQSSFLEWSIEYFREPQMRANEAEEPGSTEYNQRLWRRTRNEAVMQETQPYKEIAARGEWKSDKALLNNPSQPYNMTFHQFENHIAVADDRDTICIWDWEKNQRLNRFSNGNPVGTRISDLQYINEDDQGFLMTGSSDGVIRVFRNYEDRKNIRTASAFRAISQLAPPKHQQPIVLEWQQVSGKLLIGGEPKVIKVWVVAAEICMHDISARSSVPITSITSDQATGNTFVAGFRDGAIRVFDVRNRSKDAMVKVWKDGPGKDWVKSVHMQRGGQRELLSAGSSGMVKLWDLRMEKPLKTFRTTNDGLRTASTHEHLPVFAVGTAKNTVKVYNIVSGEMLSRLNPVSSILQQARQVQAPIATTVFHPHGKMLAVAAQDNNHVNFYSCFERKVDN